MADAPVSAIADVADRRARRLAIFLVHLAATLFLVGNNGGGGLQLGVSTCLVITNAVLGLLLLLAAPPRHNLLSHPAGRFNAFCGNSK